MELDEFGNPIVKPYQIPEEPGILDSVGNVFFDNNQVIGTDVDGVPVPEAVPEIDIPESVQPLDPAQVAQSPQPTDHDKLAAAQVILGTQGFPAVAPDPMMDQKVGSKSTTTSTTDVTPEMLAADQGRADAKTAYHDASQDLSDAEAQAAEVEYRKQEREGREIADIQDDVNQVKQAHIDEVAEEMLEIKKLAAEAANEKPETFWGSKTGADKIASALSIGLGSFGQALLGSGQNVGMVLLQRKMEEFDRNQDAQRQAKKDQIANMKYDIQTKFQLNKEADSLADGRKLSARSRISSELAKMSATAKTAQVQAAIGMKAAQFDQSAAALESQLMQQRAAKKTQVETRDIIQKVSMRNNPEVRKESHKQASDVLAQNTKIVGVRSQIKSALDQMRDPKISLDRKIGIGHDVLKAMNSTLGPDVVGADEAKRGASELTPITGDLVTKATKYGGIGAGGGATVGSLAPGIGTLIGGFAGAAGGAAIGAVDALSDGASRSGGIRFRADPEAFAQRMELALDKVDNMVRRNDEIADLMKQGITQSQATILVDQREAQKVRP